MAGKTTLRCREISKIADTLTDKAIEFYNDGDIEDFWDAIAALDVLTDVQAKVCNVIMEGG